MKFGAPLFVTVAVFSEEQLTAVYALLGGASLAAVAAAAPAPAAPAPSAAPKSEPVKPATEPASAGSATPAPESPASDGPGPSATNTASPSDADLGVDTGGHPWSPELHASTRSKTKEGYWRMKVGVSRPADLPGFPVTDAAATAAPAPSTETAPPPSATDAGTAPVSDAAASSAPAPAVEEDDEFAAFAAADAASNAAPAEIPARTWSDADLSKLCNQAASKLGNPAPVKDIIAQFVPEGEVPHSRNIPADKREDFAKAVEAKAGIEFAG